MAYAISCPQRACLAVLALMHANILTQKLVLCQPCCGVQVGRAEGGEGVHYGDLV